MQQPRPPERAHERLCSTGRPLRLSRNIEIKARIASVEALMPQVQALADEGPVELHQDDTYFVCSAGKLKLRTFSPEKGELIYYRRADQTAPKESFYRPQSCEKR
jgi:adenylate cyclase class IV